MTQYKIYRWDARLLGEKIYPEIYIRPDEDLLEFFKNNNSATITKISNSSSVYDNQEIPAIVTTIEPTRPNYFEKSGYYVIVLNSNWYGYPDNLGNAVFSGLERKGESKNPEKDGNKKESKNDTNNKYSINYNYFLVIVAILLFLFGYQKFYIKK
jgi:hypothetical protein